MLDEAIFNYYTKYYRDTLGLPNWESLAKSRSTEEQTEKKRIISFEKKVGSIHGKYLLNIGCGTGGFNVVATERGAIVYGIDPDEEAFRICHMKAEKYNIPAERFKLSNAEQLPFDDNVFDLVNCFTVLEHVADVKKTLLEMVRVTKPGGVIYTNSPHYWCLYEGHYKMFWCPLFLIRPIGKLYLFLRNRPTQFYDTLNFLNNRTIGNALKGQNVSITHFKKALVKIPGFFGTLAYFYYKVFGIDSNIEITIVKGSA